MGYHLLLLAESSAFFLEITVSIACSKVSMRDCGFACDAFGLLFTALSLIWRMIAPFRCIKVSVPDYTPISGKVSSFVPRYLDIPLIPYYNKSSPYKMYKAEKETLWCTNR